MKRLNFRLKTFFHIRFGSLFSVRTRRPRSDAQSGSRIYQFVGGGGDSQNLMLSSNLLKSKIPLLKVGGSLWNLMLSSNLLKSKIPMLRVGGAHGI